MELKIPDKNSVDFLGWALGTRKSFIGDKSIVSLCIVEVKTKVLVPMCL